MSEYIGYNNRHKMCIGGTNSHSNSSEIDEQYKKIKAHFTNPTSNLSPNTSPNASPNPSPSSNSSRGSSPNESIYPTIENEDNTSLVPSTPIADKRYRSSSSTSEPLPKRPRIDGGSSSPVTGPSTVAGPSTEASSSTSDLYKGKPLEQLPRYKQEGTKTGFEGIYKSARKLFMRSTPEYSSFCTRHSILNRHN